MGKFQLYMIRTSRIVGIPAHQIQINLEMVWVSRCVQSLENFSRHKLMSYLLYIPESFSLSLIGALLELFVPLPLFGVLGDSHKCPLNHFICSFIDKDAGLSTLHSFRSHLMTLYLRLTRYSVFTVNVTLFIIFILFRSL